MQFTIYLDESDTHGAAPNIIMGGFLGHAYQWSRFEKKLAAIQAQYGFRVFHATEFAAKTGEFRGWIDDKCLALVHDLTELVRRNLTEGFTIDLPHAAFADYQATELPHGMRAETQYALCMRGAVAHLLDVLQSYGPSTRLDVVLEEGHKNSGDARRVFEDIRKILGEFGDTLLGDFTTVRKPDAIPLMVADFMAFTYGKMRSSGTAPQDFREGGTKVWRKEAGRAGLTHILLPAEGLARLKDNFAGLQVARKENWREKKRSRQKTQAR
jgi:hypothetical protein